MTSAWAYWHQRVSRSTGRRRSTDPRRQTWRWSSDQSLQICCRWLWEQSETSTSFEQRCRQWDRARVNFALQSSFRSLTQKSQLFTTTGQKSNSFWNWCFWYDWCLGFQTVMVAAYMWADFKVSQPEILFIRSIRDWYCKQVGWFSR